MKLKITVAAIFLTTAVLTAQKSKSVEIIEKSIQAQGGKQVLENIKKLQLTIITNY